MNTQSQVLGDAVNHPKPICKMGAIQSSDCAGRDKQDNGQKPSLKNAFYKSVFGALIGDSIGSYIEFNKYPEIEDVMDALEMYGGGPHKIGKGQITDDGELALALLKSFEKCKYWCEEQDCEVEYLYNSEYAGENYREWYKSKPFDIGNATYNATSTNSYEEMVETALQKNSGSKANGALMRISPLISRALLLNSSVEEVIEACLYDASLTHASETCQIVNCYYVLMAIFMSKNKETSLSFDTLKFADTQIRDYMEHYGCFSQYEEAIEEVYEWIDEVSRGFKIDIDAMRGSSGFVKWGLQMAVFCAFRGFNYEKSMIYVLSKGGDTDTNCCIVGGFIACLDGIELPRDKLLKVYNSPDFYPERRIRPEWLQLRSYFDI